MRILVADDHSLFRDGIISLLEATGFDVIGNVGNGEDAVSETLRLNPDLVLLDISMPRLTGLEALTQIKATRPQTKVVMLTVADDDETLFRAVRAGADGFLLKSLTSEEFLELLEGLQRGEAAMTRQTTAKVLRGFSQISAAAEKPTLSKREIELLLLIADGLSNRAIAQRLVISLNTVKYHVKNILTKLDVQNRTEAVTKALKEGLISPSA